MGCCSSSSESVVKNLDDATLQSLKGKVAIITGPTAGLGKHSALVFASLGMHVVLAGRSLDRLRATEEEIRAVIPNAQLTKIQLDLASFTSIRTFVRDFMALNLPLHILMNNAVSEWE